MKMVTAIIQPFMLDKLTRALRKQALTGYTAADVQGSGADLIATGVYMAPRVKLEIAVNDDQVDMVTELILKTVGTHQDGDGIIFVTNLEEIINIQTQLRGPAALLPSGE